MNPLWAPDREQIEQTQIHRFIQRVNQVFDQNLQNYADLHRWSVAHSERFWSLLWDETGVIGERGERVVENAAVLEQARWFPDARLNFAQNLLRKQTDEPAIIAYTGTLPRAEISWRELGDRVSQISQFLQAAGVEPGDRVAGIVSHCAEAVIAMLATTALGAVWTSVSPDFGESSILERFGQSQPKVLFAIDGYTYKGKPIDITAKTRAVVEQTPGIETVVTISHYGYRDGKDASSSAISGKRGQTPFCGYRDDKAAGSGAIPGGDSSADTSDTAPGDGNTAVTHHDWHTILDTYPAGPIAFQPVGFNDPLYVMYSSGTTGKPKCIVHRVGGALLQQVKEHRLHCDIRPGDKVFWYTTCGWMMWNWIVGTLASEATLVTYDEAPDYPQPDRLFRLAEAEQLTLFGTSPAFLARARKLDLRPRDQYNLDSIRMICSTGSVLPPESFDYVYEAIKPDVCLASISGGTDILSCFMLGNPISPVYRGQCQGPGLAIDVRALNDEGNPVVGEKGELVCMNSFPSQPIGFLNDEGQQRYHDAYFAKYDNVWCHGDYIEMTEQGGVIVYGRSDATLNPGGVRIGTAEIYRYVEQLEEVEESVAIGQDWQNDVRVVLFVKLRPGFALDEALIARIKTTIRGNCTPRHVPAKILAVADIPKTKSGKVVELAVREVVHNRPVKNTGSLQNPEALEQFRNRTELAG